MAIDRTTAPPLSAPLWLRALLAPVSAAVVLAGIWLTGGVLTDDFRLSMALTALWFALVVAGGIVVWRGAPALRLPVTAVAIGTFVLVGAYLGLASVRDVTVNERVATGPAALEGTFVELAHATEGVARVVETPSGRVLTLTGFRTDPGPDLYVYVVPGHVDGASVDGGRRIARLKGNVGNQQYDLPADLDLEAGGTVVVWCRAFSVGFGAARLERT
ncbi:MAG TPA: DM13 domain-containing protein [Gaiellaceae bacterium]|nr:DM13 domain-containing protein [Gaiellaceae bacterium]